MALDQQSLQTYWVLSWLLEFTINRNCIQADADADADAEATPD